MSKSLAVTESGITSFEGMALELDTGEWKADETGIWRNAAFGKIEVACPHPIAISERLRNIDTGKIKVRLVYRRGVQKRKPWRDEIIDLDTISNAKSIVKLAEMDVSVTSGESAQWLVNYLRKVMDLNYDTIPETRSVSRLGWTKEGFSPYVDGLEFDGHLSYRRLFNAIGPCGTFKAWLEEINCVRRYNVLPRLLIAASLASVLIEPLGCLPFFVHLWGGSGSGKSVAQMAAASVWGDPLRGGTFFPTFNGTAAGYEMLAGFLNSLPLFLDDLQTAAKDGRGKLIFSVYKLASGSGRVRSDMGMGLRDTATWANCFITSGETPMLAENAAGGEVNRVIEIECQEEVKIVEDGRKTAEILKKNYGHAGKEFISRLTEPNGIERAKSFYEAYFTACLKNNTTEKQAHSAALILAADSLASLWIFKDNLRLTPEDIAGYLRTTESTNANVRGYEYMCDWVAQNSGKLKGATDIEFYGLLDSDNDKVFILRNVFFSACESAGISAKPLLSYLKLKGLIDTYESRRAYTVSKSINGVKTEYVAMHLPKQDIEQHCEKPDLKPL